MVEGYESIVTYGAALAAIQYVWAGIGALVIGLGGGIVFLGESDTSASLLRTYQAVGYGIALLTVLTLLGSVVFGAQAMFNVTKLGRTPAIGQVGIVGRHIPALAAGIGLIVAADSLPDFENALRTLGGVLVIWGLLVPAGLALGVLQMLWRTSALGDSATEPSNRDFSGWFVGMIIYVYGAVAVESMTDLTMAATGFLILMVGVGITLAAVMALRFLPVLAERQEARVAAILFSFNDDEPAAAQPVTAQQIEEAWEASSDYFSVDGH